MYKLNIYIETSVWSQAYAEDAPHLRTATNQFFAEAAEGRYDLYISNIVLMEIARAEPERAALLRRFVEQVDPIILDFDDESDRLAQEFLAQGVVPPTKIEDAQHVAVAVANELNVLTSWNYRHLVNMRRREMFHHVSVMNGYYNTLHIVTPPEVDYGR
jgi:predicted nucleic acid-binding protein